MPGVKVPRGKRDHKKKRYGGDRYIDHFDVPIKAGRKRQLDVRRNGASAIALRLQAVFGDGLTVYESRGLSETLVEHPNATRFLIEDRNYRMVVSLLREDELHAAAEIVEKLALATVSMQVA